MVRFDSPGLIRAEGRRRRRELAGAERSDVESRLCGRVGADPVVVRATIVGTYLADDGEPDLAALHASLRSRGAELALPVLDDDPTSFTMRFCRWQSGDTIVEGRFGIGVPQRLEECDPDVVLVPLVGFDQTCNRIGRGAGFYDRYLSTSLAETVGVAFACQRFQALPVALHDVALGRIVTEHETLLR